MIKKEEIKEILLELKAFDSLDDYYHNSSYSFSKIKDCYFNPESLFSDYKKTSIYLDVGSAIDIMITDVERSSKISIINKLPTEMNKKIADYLLFTYPEYNKIEDMPDEVIKEAYDVVSPDNRWTADVKRKRFITDSKEYYDAKAEDYESIILTPELNNRTMKAVASLKNHRATAKYCNGSNKNLIIFNQYSYRYEYKELQMKSLFDFLVIDTVNHTIGAVDLKTGECPFMTSFLRFKWYYQAALYQIALEALLVEFNFKMLNKDDLTPLYTIQPFRFMYINTLKPNNPIIYNISDILHFEIAYEGFEDKWHITPSLDQVIYAVKYYDAYVRELQAQGKEIDVSEISPYYHVVNNFEIILR